ncbi:head decoration protein [Mycobacterium heckeshornense]|uniref:head decoration protein n=1 Tax=Mycobacterium heckeshornense TaxID=110505 RepID=UPI00066215E1|nr:head decoration protein [Mycobacterium heckeshornense]KMV23342.1 hypothetical protein ACT16_06635 [Mycobacterium heckeshornense]
MSTDISMQTTNYQVGDRSWLLAEPDYKPNVTLDITKFTAGTHYSNGYIPSGTVIGKITASGLFGPYDPGASDGRETAYGLTYGDVRAVRQDGSTAAKVGTGAVVYDAVVSASKLPFQSGAGSIDAAGKAALAQIRWEA